jgi:hypothetical protein
VNLRRLVHSRDRLGDVQKLFSVVEMVSARRSQCGRSRNCATVNVSGRRLSPRQARVLIPVRSRVLVGLSCGAMLKATSR